MRKAIIIAILLALGGWGIFVLAGAQHVRVTQTTIGTLKLMLERHWQQVVHDADQDASAGKISPAVLALAGGDKARAKVIWRKLRLMEAFPQTYAEVQAPWVYSDDDAGNPYIPPAQQRYLAEYRKTITVLRAKNSLSESAACLLAALSVQRAGEPFSRDFKATAIRDTDGDGIPELIDGWGNPLAFFRFAWNNGPMLEANPQAVNAAHPDPLDPDGTLLDPAWVKTEGRTTFEKYVHPVIGPAVASPIPTVPYGPEAPLVGPGVAKYHGIYAAPVIVSAGPDGASVNGSMQKYQLALGFNVDAGGYFCTAITAPSPFYCPDMSIVAAERAADNLYSFQITGH